MYGSRVYNSAMPKPKNTDGCSVEDCDREVAARLLCGMHWKRWKKTGNPLGIKPGRPSRAEIGCKFEGCDNPHNAKGYCYTHYFRWKNHGDPSTKLEKGWHMNVHGYIRVMDPDNPAKTVLQHRLVMSQMVGRPLERHENVHHKNGDRADNRPENLELWSKMQPSGQRPKDKIQYALEILELYAPHLLNKENSNG